MTLGAVTRRDVEARLAEGLDISRLTRYSLKDCSLRPHADGEFVSYAALQHAIEQGKGEREALAFLRGETAVPSVRARVVKWIRGVFRGQREHTRDGADDDAGGL